MTKSAVMEPNDERIYEEIITKDFGKDHARLDRSLSCPASRKTSRDMVRRNNSLLDLQNREDNRESLYAFINGDNIEFKKLQDLLEEESTKRNIYQKASQVRDNVIGAYQPSSEAGDEKDLGESDSGCDCSIMGRDLIQSLHPLRPNKLDIKVNETLYSEILHQTPGSQIDLFPGRMTRESENPLLRQEVIPSNTPSPSTSVPASRNGSIRRSRNDENARSTSGDSGIQEDVSTGLLYENCARKDKSLRRSISSPQFYANTASMQAARPESVYANMESNESEVEMSANDSSNSLYANMEDETDDGSRPRTASRPIAIQSNQRKIQTELIYSDLDFEDGSIPEYLSSSPGDTSSTSSGLSSFTTHLTNSFSPPPLPSRPPSVYARRRQISFSSISVASSFAPNNMRASFIGTISVHKASKDNINSSIKEIVHKTNMLNVKSVYVEVSKMYVKFCSFSTPYNCVLQFSVDEIHIMDHYSKDQRFLGFIVGQPGKEAVCHVFQSDQTVEILDAVKETFKESPWNKRVTTPERPKSFYGKQDGLSIYSGILKIGSLKVRKSLLVINDYIHELLEKVNPKQYALVQLEVKDSSVILVTSDSGMKVEEHSIAWILSLGLYNNDGRYFGFIVTRTKGGKTRMFCHVYKCSTVMISATILEGIRNACQGGTANGRVQGPRCSSSVPRSAFRTRLMTSPDAVSRSSASSDETLHETNSPRLAGGSDSNAAATPRLMRSFSFDNENSEQTNGGELYGRVEVNEGSSTERVVVRPGETTGTLKAENASRESRSNAEDVRKAERETVDERSNDEVDCVSRTGSGEVVLDKTQSHSSPAAPTEDDVLNAMAATAVSESRSVVKESRLQAESSGEQQVLEQHSCTKESHKEKKSPFLKNKGKIFRGTLMRKKKDPSSKLSVSMQSLDCIPREEEELIPPHRREEHEFLITYLCSAVVKPPLKSKHVEKCLKQFQKEVGKKQKLGHVSSLGNKLQVRVVTDEGVTMLDKRSPNSFRRHFPVSTIDSFIMHPENPDCFAFSTTVPGDEQHKYHLFYKSQESIATVKEAFERLKQFQKFL